MIFKKLELSDIAEVRPFFDGSPVNTCDFTVGGTFMWRNSTDISFCIEDGILYFKVPNEYGELCYGVPLGGDFDTAVSKVLDEASGSACFCAVPECYLDSFRAYDSGAVIIGVEKFSDYLYYASDLAKFPGRNYSAQRNHVNRFLRENPGAHFDDITSENLPALKAWFSEYRNAQGEEDNPDKRMENSLTLDALENYGKYDALGGILYAGENICGFAMGERKGDTLFVHFEKADKSYNGVYQMLVKSFSERFSSDGILYINREDDAGDPGLRKSKLSYRPCALLKKYKVLIGKGK